jgi:hypothetical protein
MYLLSTTCYISYTNATSSKFNQLGLCLHLPSLRDQPRRQRWAKELKRVELSDLAQKLAIQEAVGTEMSWTKALGWAQKIARTQLSEGLLHGKLGKS